MNRWIRFFFGSPQRFLGSLVGIGFVICLINPSIFERALNQAITAVITALQPLIGPCLALIIVFAGIRMILGGGRKK